MSVDDQAIIGRIVNRTIQDMDFGERQTMMETAQEVLRLVAKYTYPSKVIQRECDHSAYMIALQKQNMDLQAHKFLTP